MKRKYKLICIIVSLIIAVALLVTSFAVYFTSIKNRESKDYGKDSDYSDDDLSDEDSSEDDSSDTDLDGKDISLTYKIASTWEDGEEKCSQVDVVVTNLTDKQLDKWSAQMEIPDGATVKQAWNTTYSQDGRTLTFNPPNETAVIAPKGSFSFGLIIKGVGGNDDLRLTSITADKFTAVAGQSGDNNNQQNTGNSEPVAAANALKVPDASTDDWLSVKGNKIVDSHGKEVWLTGVNWFGYNTGTNTFDGLWSADLNSSLQGIADKGFNLLRVPISAELILQWKNGQAPKANFNQATNNYLVGMDSLQIFDYVVGQCRANGLKIMIDIHSVDTDPMGHMKSMWYSSKVSTDDYLAALSWMAQRYAGDDTIIAYDLKNEPHGKPSESPRAMWNNSKSEQNWKYAAERAALAVLSKNPNALVMVEGIEVYPTDIKTNGDYSSKNDKDYYFNWWGGNLRGVKDYPLELGKYQNKLVYSPHDYGPTVYEQPWFKKDYTFKTLYDDCWKDNWMYIYKDNIAPLLIGEWGGYMKDPNLKWMTYMRQLIKENRLNHTFWCFNANSGDTGGLVLDDFKTWDMDKYNFVKEVLWQKDGKFVGLDHKIPLGKNGTVLS